MRIWWAFTKLRKKLERTLLFGRAQVFYIEFSIRADIGISKYVTVSVRHHPQSQLDRRRQVGFRRRISVDCQRIAAFSRVAAASGTDFTACDVPRRCNTSCVTMHGVSNDIAPDYLADLCILEVASERRTIQYGQRLDLLYRSWNKKYRPCFLRCCSNCVKQSSRQQSKTLHYWYI